MIFDATIGGDLIFLKIEYCLSWWSSSRQNTIGRIILTLFGIFLLKQNWISRKLLQSLIHKSSNQEKTQNWMIRQNLVSLIYRFWENKKLIFFPWNFFFYKKLLIKLFYFKREFTKSLKFPLSIYQFLFSQI